MKMENMNGGAQAETEAEIMRNSDTIEQSAAKDPFATGRERMAKIGGFFSKIKEKAKSIASSAGDSISIFLNKSKEKAITGTAAVLSAPELAKEGAEYVGDKIEKFDEYTDQKAQEVGAVIGEKMAQGYEWSKNTANKAGDALDKGFEYAFDKVESAENWIANKGEQMVDITKQGAELTAALAMHAADKTKEGFNNLKDGVVNQYDRVVAFKDNSIAAGKMKVAEIVQNYRNRLNEARMRVSEQQRKEALEALAQEAQINESDIDGLGQSIEEIKQSIKLREQAIEAKKQRQQELMEMMSQLQTAA